MLRGLPARNKLSLNELIYRFTLETGTGSAGTLLLEQDDPTGQPNFFTNEDFVEGEIIQKQSPYADNLDLDTAGGFDTETVEDDILDFTESNPFGDLN